MKSHFSVLVLIAALGAPPVVHAQHTVFNAALTGDQLNPPAYPMVTPSTTGWAVLSNKNVPAPTESGGVLTINMAGTTSGFIEAQALFAPAPVQLLPGTSIAVAVTFVPTFILTNPSDNLIVGLYNSGGSAPLTGLAGGGLGSALTTFASGGARGWIGYCGNIPFAGASPRLINRAAQTAANNTVQDVVVDSQSTSVGYSAPAGTSASGVSAMSATLTNGSSYTLGYQLALSADGLALTATVSLYSGAGTTGAGVNPLLGSYTGTFTGGALLTRAFDALAIGWRADAGGANLSNLGISALTVKTTGGAPWFATQPPAGVLVSTGSELTLVATGAGTVESYQWQVSRDQGGTFVNLDPSATPSAATAVLTLPDVQSATAGLYRLVATNAAGSTPSTNCSVTVSATPVAPSISTDPAAATVLSGAAHTFAVVANGTSPLAYQWERSADGTAFTPIGEATDASYTLPAVSLGDAGYYRVVVSNLTGTATSAAAWLTVDQPLALTAQPVGAALHLGDSYTLSVTAAGLPAPTYQWYLNGNALAGATGATYPIVSATAAAAGIYTVTASNSAGDRVTSAGAAVAVLSATLATAATTPAAASDGAAPDARLTLSFNQPVSVGLMGTVNIYDQANPTVPVDTIDLAAATATMRTLLAANSLSTQPLPVQTKTIGGVTRFNYYPITVAGNTATIYPRNGVLTYGHTYSVTIDPGVFTDRTGLAYAGIGGNSGWVFTTRNAGPSAGATRFTVAADGTGDFTTVQAALDFIPANNTVPRTILIRKGTYFEEVCFQSKHALTLLGEDADGTVIAYPNNAVFNNAGGVYHRATFFANAVHDCTIANLTVANTTPQNGAQAEAVIVSGTSPTAGHNLVTGCKFYSYQDTVQFNNQIYVSDSTICGDVDFMWGGGPAFFENCELRIFRSGGYFTQIRNGSTNHGYVYDHCRFTAPAGITGALLGRIDPTPSGFPFSEVVVLDSTFGDAANPAFLATTTGADSSNYFGGWWLLNNVTDAAAASTVHNWTGHLVTATGGALTNPNADLFTTMPADAATQANYRDPAWVLNTSVSGAVNGTWTPALPPLVAAGPAAQTVAAGAAATLSVSAVAIPAPTFQWRRNGVDLPGATAASYLMPSAGAADAGIYSVVVTNSAGSVTTADAALVVNGGPPVITLDPVAQTALAGTNVSLSVFAVGPGPLTYQWFKAGVPVAGATGPSLLLPSFQAAAAGSYTVTVSNAGGDTTSHAAAVTLATPAAGFTPTLPTIPPTIFDVTAYGAVGDGVTDNTGAIAAAITAAKNAGGGIIELPPAAGSYRSGPIALSSNLDLQVDGGATLQMLPYGAYPNPNVHFITWASGSSNIAITGNGVIDGDGAAWWTAYNSGLIAQRPRLVQLTKATNVLVAGVTLQNSPSFHLAFSGANTNVTIFGATISAPGDSPNTDGMDLAGTNILVQNCTVSDGDDNIVAKPGSTFCGNLVIAHCTIGTGHGVSVGGQTNVGLDGMLVTDCTFDGTSSAIRLKADPTQGGPVQNVTFQNLTMKNVLYPILFYSYYNVLGSPGATSGSSQITPAKVNAYNSAPPNPLALPTIPTWKNITISRLTVSNSSGYSTIWGLPLADALIQNVTLDNVTIEGGAGLELYNAANIRFTGTNLLGPVITDNALALTGQPGSQTVGVGDPVTFSVTAVGGGGTNNLGITYRWNHAGTPLADGPQADGSTVSGATTSVLTLTGVRVTLAGDYTVTASTRLDGFDVTSNALVPNLLPVSATSSAAALTVNPLAATVTLSNLAFTYDGAPRSATVTTVPADLAVQLTYDGSTTAPTAAGSYAVAATVTDPNYTGSASGTLVIASAAPANFVSWQQAVFTAAELADAAVSGPTAVYGHDGLPNLVKYALGLSPQQNVTGGLPRVNPGTGRWTYAYTRPSGLIDITYTVETSPDLVHWTPVSAGDQSVISADGVDTCTATLPMNSALSVFFRLKISQ